MNKVNEDFLDFVVDLFFHPENNVIKQAEMLLLKEECNDEEIEVLDFTAQNEIEMAQSVALKYLIRKARRAR